VPLAHFAMSGVVVTNSGGTTTYVDGTDYIVNDDLGWVKALSGGAIADAASLKVDYALRREDRAPTSKARPTPTFRVKFKFDGKNQVDGLPVQVDVYEAVIAADNAFDFLADDFNKITLPGRMKTPSGFTHPFKVRQLTT
jgi:hypothetical protein